MKIEEICNSSLKTSMPLKTIINLKNFGSPLFPIEYNIGVDWDKLQSTLSNFNGHFYETSLNQFYIISLNYIRNIHTVHNITHNTKYTTYSHHIHRTHT